MSAYTALLAAGTTTRAAAALTGIARATMDRAGAPAPPPLDPAPRVEPRNKLSRAEEQQILAVLHSDEFIDQAPAQVYATLLGRGRYLCSTATLYRILRRHNEVRDRRRQARHPSRARPELTATGPGQVYTWDITKLRGPTKGTWFQLYVLIDIYSRFNPSWIVSPVEDSALAADFIAEAIDRNGATPHTVHADRGTSMTSKPVSALLADLGVTRSHSRPRVSNDCEYESVAASRVWPL